MIDYPHFRKAHLPLGSGIVESGQKVVIQRRFKQAGMRWAEANLNPMLALRTAVCNKTWATSWQAIRIHHRQTRQLQRLSRLQSPVQSKPAVIITETDCQRLEALAYRIEIKSKPKRPWHNHKWVFPHRHTSLHNF